MIYPIKKNILNKKTLMKSNKIKKIKIKNTNYYYYVHSTLDIMEAKAIVDLVYSSNFFTLKTKENYLKRMQSYRMRIYW